MDCFGLRPHHHHHHHQSSAVIIFFPYFRYVCVNLNLIYGVFLSGFGGEFCSDNYFRGVTKANLRAISNPTIILRYTFPVVAVSDPKLNSYANNYVHASGSRPSKPIEALFCPQRRGLFRVKLLCFRVRLLLVPSGLTAITGSR